MKSFRLPLLVAALLLTSCQEERPPQSVIDDWRKTFEKAPGPNTFEVLKVQYAKSIAVDRENGPLPKGTRYFPVRFNVRRHEPGQKVVDYDDDEYFCQDLFGKWVRAFPPSSSNQ